MLKISLLALPLAVALSGCQACGYSSQQNDLTGQVKKVISRTPIICPDYTEVDVSLGYIRNGGGSVSKEDVVLSVHNQAFIPLLKQAADSGEPVKVTYNVFRASICEPEHELTAVQIIK